MRAETIARNYAETLFELARSEDGIEGYGAGIATVARLIDENPAFREFLGTPRIDPAAKKELVMRVFGDSLPRKLLNFVRVTIDKRRQRLLRRIDWEYQALVDEHMGRAHVDVTVAHALDEEGHASIARRLSTLLGKEAIPHVRVDSAILGGIVVRTGDTIYDGSLRRRMGRLERQLVAADLSAVAGASENG